jgi:hypothetical protein
MARYLLMLKAAIILLMLAIAPFARAQEQQPMGVIQNCWTGTAYRPCQIFGYTPASPMQANLAIASSTALTVPTGADYAVVCAEGANARYTTDGTTTPTASVGMPLLLNQCVSIVGQTALANFRAIQQSATSTLDISYFK